MKHDNIPKGMYKYYKGGYVSVVGVKSDDVLFFFSGWIYSYPADRWYEEVRPGVKRFERVNPKSKKLKLISPRL